MNYLRNWILSRMNVDENSICKAINREQYLFWQAKAATDRLNKQINWHEKQHLWQGPETPNERRKRIYFRLSDRLLRRRYALDDSPEWKAFEVISHELIEARNHLGIRALWYYNAFPDRKRWTVEDCLLQSRDILRPARCQALQIL